MTKEPRADDPILLSPLAPHETAAALRLQRAGWPSPKLMKTLGMSATKLMGALSKAMDEEQLAHRCDRPIHDALIPKEKS